MLERSDLGPIQHSRQDKGKSGVQRHPNLYSPSTVEGKEGGMFQVDVLQGPVDWGGVVDLRIPRYMYSLTTSNFSPLIVQEMEREVLEPKKTLD